MDLLDALSQTFDHATKIVAGVQNDQLNQPTPCTQWDVRSVLSHMFGVVANIGRGASGQELLADVNSFPNSDPSHTSHLSHDRTSTLGRALPYAS